MSKVIKLQAQKGMRLTGLSESEIVELVSQQADAALASLPRSVRPADVNTVILESNPAEVADIGGWAQWTRACCDRRHKIADFINPTVDQLQTGLSGVNLRKLGQDHFDSNLSVRFATESFRPPRKKTTTRRKRS